MTDHSSRCHLPCLEESLMSLDNLSNRKGGEVELSHALTGRSMSCSEVTGHKKEEGNKNLMVDKF
jgi:hypothetical protein